MKILLLGSAPNEIILKVASFYTNEYITVLLDLVVRFDRKQSLLKSDSFNTVFSFEDEIINVNTESTILLIKKLKKNNYDLIVVIQPDVDSTISYDNVKAFAKCVKPKKKILMDRNCVQHPMRLVKKKLNFAKTVGEYWNKNDSNKKPCRIRFWQSPLIMSHYNQLLSGEPGGTYATVIKKMSDQNRLERGVSVGCGSGNLEMNLIKSGQVEHFDLFDYSTKRIQLGRTNAQRMKIANKVKFSKRNAFEIVKKNSMDLVFWNNSLHHMQDVEVALKWSFDVLKKSGIFFMNDFVGPTRFQWSTEMLEVASRFRSLLPSKYLKHPSYPGKLLGKTIRRPNPQLLSMHDPSEAADSSRIIESVLKYFPDAQITFLGGVIYYLALNDVLHNFDENNPSDRLLLKTMLLADELLTNSKTVKSLYAAAFAKK